MSDVMALTLLFLFFCLWLRINCLVKTFSRNLSECFAKLCLKLLRMIQLLDSIMSFAALLMIWTVFLIAELWCIRSKWATSVLVMVVYTSFLVVRFWSPTWLCFEKGNIKLWFTTASFSVPSHRIGDAFRGCFERIIWTKRLCKVTWGRVKCLLIVILWAIFYVIS